MTSRSIGLELIWHDYESTQLLLSKQLFYDCREVTLDLKHVFAGTRVINILSIASVKKNAPRTENYHHGNEKYVYEAAELKKLQ